MLSMTSLLAGKFDLEIPLFGLMLLEVLSLMLHLELANGSDRAIYKWVRYP